MTLTNDAHPFASLNIILVMLFNTLSTLHTNRSLSARPHTCDPPPLALLLSRLALRGCQEILNSDLM